MLVFSRKEGERFRVGDGIVIEVVQIRGDKVRIGITAPSAIPIYREEVWNRIQRAEFEGEKNNPEES